jgi:hypothetical protein
VSTETTETVTTRTFYRSDYARFASALRRARHVQGDRYTAKSQASQHKVIDLAVAVADLFEADAPDYFDTAKFMASTQLPQAESHEASEPGEDETANEGNLLTDG